MSNETVIERHPDAEAFGAFIDGGLAEAERARLVAHFAECRQCRDILAAYARGATTPVPGLLRRLGQARVWLPIAATVVAATSIGLLITRVDRAGDVRPEAPSAAPTIAPPAAAPPKPRATEAPAPPPAATEDLSTRRSGVREISGKTFRLVDGEWVDTDYDPLDLLPVEQVGTTSSAAVFAKVPALKAFAALGPRVTVVHGGVVYRIDID